MKVYLAAFLLSGLCLSGFAGHAKAMGQPARVFELTSTAGIWDGEDAFYLRIDLAEIANLKDQKFVWAGFQRVSDGLYAGELVLDQFGPQEKKFQARAKVLSSTAKGRTFFIEVFDDKGVVIKELFIKGGSSE